MEAATPSLLCALTALGLRLADGRFTVAGKAMLGALPLFLMQMLGRLRQAAEAKKKHPGTAEQRAMCLNPVIDKQDFEERFIGTADLESGDFDYIVVVAGSAGCPLAARLAKSGASVLLLEAGGEAHRSREVQMPKRMYGLWQSEVDWGFRSVPQEHLLPRGRVIDLERGKTLGGSSAINYNMWVRGAPEDYDRWAEEFGCSGWSYKEVLPHFKSIESLEGYDQRYRGDLGPVKVAQTFPPMEEVEDFMRACEATGAERNPDYNAAKLPGAGLTQFNTAQGGREDCFSAFIEPLLRWYPNLRVASETFCHKVVLEESEGQVRATSVVLELRSGQIITVKCRHEVILSAGAVLTPQLLMLSGIGEKEHLKEHGIPCLRDLPVGQNMQDHPFVPSALLGHARTSDATGAQYRNSSGMNAQLFWQSDLDKKREKKLKRSLGADIQIIFVNRPDPSMGLKAGLFLAGQKLFGSLSPDYRSDYKLAASAVASLMRSLLKFQSVREAFTARFFSLTIVNNHNQSRGTVRLRSADPHEPPLIDPRHFSDPQDLEAFVQGYRRMMAVLKHDSMTKHMDPTGVVPLPSADGPQEEIENYILKNSQTTWHYSCTTPMGAVGDPKAVCDPEGRVQGVRNLRVCDAGLMPVIVSGNTNAPCVMMGDKVGAMMARDYAGREARESRGTAVSVPSAASAAPAVAPVALKSSL